MRSLRTSWLARTLVVLLFALLTGEQGMLHACPLHEQSKAPVENAHIAAGHHAAADHSHASESSHGSQHTNCNCLGTCAIGATIAAPDVVVAFVPVPEVIVRESRETTYDSPSYQPRADHQLPYGNGPPQLT